ncbi:alpha/beta fold hydrolase [Rhodovulum sp. DZ06]|uniref:alpha/beta fold hydrolase n=1 Tax=Rhodovulum sp. DZ06 TaxID=3425126 RepID=UPI003D3423A2
MPFFHAPDGLRLHFEDTGNDAPPVLCLAGLTRNVADFAHLPALLPEYRVIRLSTRGRGASGHAADPATEYQVGVEAGDALALLDHLGISRVAVIGTSRGGILGMLMHAMRPGLLSGLVLNDVGSKVEVAGLTRIAGYAGKQVKAPDFAEAARRMQEVHAADFPGVSEARWEAYARAIYDADEDGRPVISYDPAIAEISLAGLAEAPPQIDLSALWTPCAGLPVLALRGANSDILSAETLAEMAGQEGCTTAVIPDRGHAPFLDEPEAAAALRGFLPGL